MTDPQILAMMTVYPWVCSSLAKQSQFLQLFLFWQHGFCTSLVSLSFSSKHVVSFVYFYISTFRGLGMSDRSRAQLAHTHGVTRFPSVQGRAQLALVSGCPQKWLILVDYWLTSQLVSSCYIIVFCFVFYFCGWLFWRQGNSKIMQEWRL
jgi:hypothetical protein